MADAVNLEVGSKSPIFDTVDSKGIRHNFNDSLAARLNSEDTNR